MSFPFADLVVMSVVGAVVSVGIATWWWLSRRTKRVRDALGALMSITALAPAPSNEAEEEAAPQSGIRLRPGARISAAD